MEENIENEGIVGEVIESTELEEKEVKEINQEAVNKRIAEKHSQYLEAENKRKQEEKRRLELESELAKYKEKESVVVIPPLPDPYDSEYDAKIALREAAVARKAVLDAEKQKADATKKQTEEQKKEEAQKAYIAKTDQYFKNAATFNIDKQEIITHASKIIDYIDPGTEEWIMDEPKGPLIVEYLGKNPLEADKLSKMNPLQKVAFLATYVVPKLNPTKIKNHTPPERVLEGDTPSGIDPMLKGARFY